MTNRSLQLFLLSLVLPLFACLLLALQTPNALVSNNTTSDFQKDTVLAAKLIEEEEKLREQKEYSAALEVLEQAIKLYTKHEEWEKAINCIVKQAKLADVFETADAKLQYSELAVQLAKNNLSPKHPVLAAALRQQAEALIWIEKIDKGNQLLLEAIPIFEENQIWIDWAWSQIFLGVNHLNANNLESSQKYFENVDALLHKQVLKEDKHVSIETTLLSLLGILY